MLLFAFTLEFKCLAKAILKRFSINSAHFSDKLIYHYGALYYSRMPHYSQLLVSNLLQWLKWGGQPPESLSPESSSLQCQHLISFPFMSQDNVSRSLTIKANINKGCILRISGYKGLSLKMGRSCLKSSSMMYPLLHKTFSIILS